MFSVMKRLAPGLQALAFTGSIALAVGASPTGQQPGDAPDDPSADDVAEEAEAPAEPVIDEDTRAEIDEYFAICDHDENGWIAFREARESLELGRSAYASYDRDRDGRIDPAEFEERYLEIVDIAGGFARPKEYEGKRPLPSRNPEQLRAAFDATGDGALELFEVDKLLEVYDRQDIPARIVLSKLDVDASRRLEISELERLSQLLSATYVASDEDLASEQAASVEELFGGVIERPPSEFGGTLHPPQIVGPVSPFRRLDLDYDGAIEIEDLRHLQRPQTLSVRVAAIVAALDQDEDGSVDRAEFLAAMDE